MEKKGIGPVIVCPRCGAEYLPAEIFIDNEIEGKPASQPVKDALGKILYAEYEEGSAPCQPETYVCDRCGRTFKVFPKAEYRTEQAPEEEDFADQAASLN